MDTATAWIRVRTPRRASIEIGTNQRMGRPAHAAGSGTWNRSGSVPLISFSQPWRIGAVKTKQFFPPPPVRARDIARIRAELERTPGSFDRPNNRPPHGRSGTMLTRRALLMATAAAGGAAMTGLSAGRATAQEQLRVPYQPPSSSWSQTQRQSHGSGAACRDLIKQRQITNVGGTAAARCACTIRRPMGGGRPNALMVGGMVMTGAIIANKSPVTLENVAPIARLTGEFEAVVVPRRIALPEHGRLRRRAESQTRQGAGGWRLGGRHRPHPVQPHRQVGRRRPHHHLLRAFAGGGRALGALLGDRRSQRLSWRPRAD